MPNRQGILTNSWLLNPADQQQRNMRSVLIDGIGVGIVSGAVSFLGVFLVRLGASSFLVGLLTALPALTGMLLALPVGRFLERQRNMAPWYSRARVLVQSSYALIGLIPFLLGVGNLTATAIVIVWAIATIPQTIVNITFTIVMGAVAGPRQRQFLMSRRWSVLGVTTAITVVCIGWLLERFSFPFNYQMIFIGSFLGGMLSYAFSSRIVIPDNIEKIGREEQLSIGQRLQAMREQLRANAPFSHFVISAFVFNLGMTLALPLFPLYWVRELHAGDFWIGLINTVNSGIVMVGYFLWSVVARRYGNGFVLRVCAFGLVLYPLLTGLTRSVPPLVFYAALAGIFGAGLSLVLFDISLATCPPESIASYIALYQFTTYVSTLVAPLLSPLLADQFGFSMALFVSAALRFVGALLFVMLGVGAMQIRRSETNEEPI